MLKTTMPHRKLMALSPLGLGGKLVAQLQLYFLFEFKSSCLGGRIEGVSLRISADRGCLNAIAEKLIRSTRGLILP